MKLTLPHIVAYVVGGLTALATLQPTVAGVLQSLLGPYGHYVPAGIAAAGALLAFLHDVAPTAVPAPPASAPASKQSGFVTLRGLVLLASAAVSIVCMTAACSTVSKFLGTPDGTVALTAAADVAVATAESKGIAAAKINAIAKAALAADSSTTATLATVSAAANAAIAKSGMPALDVVAVQVIEESLAAAIQAKLGSNPSVASAQATVADVLKAVIAASGG